MKRADPVQTQGVGYIADAFFLWAKYNLKENVA